MCVREWPLLRESQSVSETTLGVGVELLQRVLGIEEVGCGDRSRLAGV